MLLVRNHCFWDFSFPPPRHRCCRIIIIHVVIVVSVVVDKTRKYVSSVLLQIGKACRSTMATRKREMHMMTELVFPTDQPVPFTVTLFLRTNYTYTSLILVKCKKNHALKIGNSLHSLWYCVSCITLCI